ncbi:MAG: ABC transporter permease [Clostridiales bacterium]
MTKKVDFYFKLFLVAILITVVLMLIMIIISPILYTKQFNLFKMILSSEIMFSLKMSLITSIIAIIITIFIALPVSYFLSKYNFIGKKQIEILFSLPMVIPPLFLGVSLLILCGPILGDKLEFIGIDFVYTPLGIILAQYVVVFPLMVQVFKNSFDEIDKCVLEAANVDGATELKILLEIIIPISLSKILSGISLSWARAIGEFGVTMMLAGITKFKTETLTSSIYLNISTGEIEKAVTVAFILLIISVVILSSIKFFERLTY